MEFPSFYFILATFCYFIVSIRMLYLKKYYLSCVLFLISSYYVFLISMSANGWFISSVRDLLWALFNVAIATCVLHISNVHYYFVTIGNGEK